MKLSPALIVAVVAAFITGVIGPMAVTFYQGQQEEAKEERRLAAGVIDTETLLGHSLFTHADTWVDLIIPQTQVSDEARLFLTIKFTAFHDALEDMVKNTNFDSLNNEQFHAVTSKNLNDTVVSYIADARRQGISDEFIADFNIWHQQVVDILVDSIEDNVYSPIHTSQNSKMYAILTAYDSALGATLEDVARTLESNGHK
jgi:Arc/MetJ family transcription regulator